jgi:hypothetical protein
VGEGKWGGGVTEVAEKQRQSVQTVRRNRGSGASRNDGLAAGDSKESRKREEGGSGIKKKSQERFVLDAICGSIRKERREREDKNEEPGRRMRQGNGREGR